MKSANTRKQIFGTQVVRISNHDCIVSSNHSLAHNSQFYN